MPGPSLWLLAPKKIPVRLLGQRSVNCMRYLQSMQAKVLVGFGVVGGLALLAGCAVESTHVRWSDQLAVIEPTPPPLQGSLEVYSERFVAWDGDVPRPTRRPVKVYSVDGQLVVSSPEQDGESPIRFTLPPGHYIVASEDQMR